MLESSIPYPIVNGSVLLKQYLKKQVLLWWRMKKVNCFPLVHHLVGECALTNRKLNAVTRKDHFSLPFVDQILEWLAGQYFFFIFQMVIRGIIRYFYFQMTKRRPPSLAPTALSLFDVCRSDSAMHPLHFNGAFWPFFQI